MTRCKILATTVVATAMLGACGGGSGPGGGFRPPSEVESLTGSQPPLETTDEQSARIAGVISRSDSLILSTVHFETNDPDFPTLQLRATCSGTRCTLREPRTGYYDTVRISDIEFVSGTTHIAHSKHGITLFGGQGVGGSYDATIRGFGSWMNHSGFQVGSLSAVVDGTSVQMRRGIAGGDLAGSSPDTSATWRGIMVGTPVSGSDRGDFLQGDARLTYGFNASGYAEIDAAFTNIKNIDRNRDYSTASIRFDGPRSTLKCNT